MSVLIESELAPGLRDAMRQLAGGVAIVSAGRGEARNGLTATSVTSLTLDPPCLLVCVNRRASAWPLMRDEGRFCVNILAEHHRPLALRFSGVGGAKGVARFEGGSWEEGPNGSPVLTDALAAIECDLEDLVERHSHVIVIGAARSVRVGGGAAALLYRTGLYGRFQPL